MLRFGKLSKVMKGEIGESLLVLSICVGVLLESLYGVVVDSSSSFSFLGGWSLFRDNGHGQSFSIVLIKT